MISKFRIRTADMIRIALHQNVFSSRWGLRKILDSYFSGI